MQLTTNASCAGKLARTRQPSRYPTPSDAGGRKVTSHYDIDRFGVASTADESYHSRYSPPACAGQSLTSSLPAQSDMYR